MPNSIHDQSDQARVAELKRLITSRRFDSLESLEDVVDAFLWGNENAAAPDAESAEAAIGRAAAESGEER